MVAFEVEVMGERGVRGIIEVTFFVCLSNMLWRERWYNGNDQCRFFNVCFCLFMDESGDRGGNRERERDSGCVV